MSTAAVDSPMRAAARRYAGRTALIAGERSWTFAQFDHTVDRLAGGLAARLAPGERVALYMLNSAEYVLLSVALERSGLVRVPLNVRYTPHEVASLLADSQAAAIFHDAHAADGAHEAVRSSGLKLWQLSIDGPGFGELLAASPIAADASSANIDALASITYTSGSSGRPKGVMLTHGNWRAVTRNMLNDRRIGGEDRVAHIGPLTHASGTYVAPFFLRGATSIIVTDATVDGLLEVIEKHCVTGFTCVPTLLTRIVNHRELERYDLSSMVWIGFGAEAIPLNTLEKAISRFGPILTQNYGLTEAMMTCSFLAPEHHFRPGQGKNGRPQLRTGCIGRSYTFVDIVLRDAEGRPVPSGEVGEITVRAEHVMKGYWRRDDETAEVLRDGWLHSGDLAHMDEEGFIYLAGRAKEMIISGGFNIYPQEVEACLTGSAGVLEAAVVGVPSADFGEMAVAFVVASPGSSITEESLTAYCKPRIGIKTPKHWAIVAELAKTPNGKVDKAAVKRRCAELGWT